MSTVTGAILTGGRSTRMGRDKALLPFGPVSLVEAVAGRLREVCPEILLVTARPEAYRHLGLRTVPDALAEQRSLVGIYTAIVHAPGPVFVCACDMPFLNPALVRHLISLAASADVVIPRHRDYEPLHAVYTRTCLEPIRRCLAAGGRNAGFLPDVRARVVEAEECRRFDPDLRSFVNLNTRKEYEAAVALTALP